MNEPSLPTRLRSTPGGDRCFVTSAFWRRRSEVGPAASFGVGDRPDQGNQSKEWSIGPDNYGDVTKFIGNTRRNLCKKITVKALFPTMEEKYRDLSWPECGPGPGKYDTRTNSATESKAYTIGARGIVDAELRQSTGRPGPADYSTRVACGRNSLIKKGSLYDVSIKGRLVHNDKAGDISPGPARYIYKTGLEEYGLWDKISNVKSRRSDGPFSRKARMSSPSLPSIDQPFHGSRDEDRSSSRTLAHSASSPCGL